MKRAICLLYTLVMLLLPTASQASLVKDRNASINDTTQFDLTDSTDTSCVDGSGVAGSLTGSSNQEKIWNFLISKGLSPIQAAGLMGNMAVESAHTFSPTVQQIGSPWPQDGWGLAQWTGGRRDTLVRALFRLPGLSKYYAAVYGGALFNQPGMPAVDPKTGTAPGITAGDNDALVLFELNFLYQESTHRAVTATGYGSADNEWDLMKKQTTILDAVKFWEANFEISADPNVQKDRGDPAQQIFNLYSGKTAPGDTSTTASDSCSTTPTGNITAFQQTILDYAWPDYKGSPFTDFMPKFAIAVRVDAARGEYVGVPAGIDCGGFTTMALRDSGWIPHYNAQNGNTYAQYDWAKANMQDLGPGPSMKSSQMQPGDVAIDPTHHTFLWVGKIPGFHSNIASASQYDRSPMAGGDSLNESGFEWFRKK